MIRGVASDMMDAVFVVVSWWCRGGWVADGVVLVVDVVVVLMVAVVVG